MPERRIRQARGELCGFVVVEVGGRLLEVVPARGLGAVDAVPELHHVQVQLQDPALAGYGTHVRATRGVRPAARWSAR